MKQSTPSGLHYVTGAKTAHGQVRPAYWANPETSRDPPMQVEVKNKNGDVIRRYWPGGKIWRKAREGKL